MCGIQTALAALYMRERTSRGQYIEVPMFETMVQLVLGDHLGGETFDPPTGAMGYQRLLTPHRRPFRTRDGYIALLVYTDEQWRQFFDAIGQPETLQDPRFSSASARARHYDSLYAILAAVVETRTSAEWVRLMRVAARWSDADLSFRRHAPRAGEHSIELLREAGYDEREVERLLATGVIAQVGEGESPA